MTFIAWACGLLTWRLCSAAACKPWMVLQVGFDRDMKGLEAFAGAAKGHSTILLAAQVSSILMLG